MKSEWLLRTPTFPPRSGKETKRWLDQCAHARGINRSDLVESALRHHLQELHDLPADVIIPPRLLVSRESGERILAGLRKPPSGLCLSRAPRRE